MNESKEISIKISTGLIAVVVFLELVYILLRNVAVSTATISNLSPMELEIAISLFRLGSIVLLLVAFWVFKTLPKFRHKVVWNTRVLSILVVLLVIALMRQTHSNFDTATKAVYAITTILVALREELVYRYVLQNWLEKVLPASYRIVGSIGLSSFVFALYHIGMPAANHMGWIIVISLLFGVLYNYSGKNILLLVGTHLIYDLFYV